MMPHLRVLIVEDSEDDTLLTIRELRRGGYTVYYVRVDTPASMHSAIEQQSWDIVIADYTLPAFSAPAALQMLQGLKLDLPFIIVSGTIGEDIAVASMKAGANDYIIKGNLARLVPAVERELREAQERHKRHIAEQALRDSEARYRLLFESNPHPMWVFDSQTLAFLAVNRAAIEHYGYSEAEFLRLTITEICLPEDINGQLAMEALGMATSYNRANIWKHRKKDGSLIDVEVVIHTLSFAGRQANLVLVDDITQRLQAEQKIREQAALLDIATDAIFVRDMEHHILFWNKGAERLYGWNWAEALNKNAVELLYNDDILYPFDEIEATLLKAGKWQGELQQVTKSGKKITVESRWTLVLDETGVPKSILTVSTDITEKKQLEAQFLRAQRLESLGTLASGIAHDFNNILTPILAVAQLLPLKLPNIDDSTQQLLEILENSAKRGADIVKQILSFSRGGVEGSRTIVQVRHLLADVAQVARRTFPKSIQTQADMVSDLWTIHADATHIHQVLMNLIVNARDAMPNGGNLSISAKNISIEQNYARMYIDAQVGPYIAITITDTGVGIPPEIIDRIFDPFFTTKEVGKGTGLGLSTVIGIVKSHGGFVNAYSEVGKGSRFQVFLPSNQAMETVIADSTELLIGNHELILVVDDEATICEIAKTTLETHNYRVLTASNGIEALALYAQYKDTIDVVLTDMIMPEMDGSTMILTLQSINPQVKIIAMSGLMLDSTNIQKIGQGIQKCLSKPFTAQALLSALKFLLYPSLSE